jgi:hypothetical protein
MFPQLNRRDIMWDLQRNGGSVAATTERILGGGSLSPVCSWFFGLRVIIPNTLPGTTLFPTYNADPTYNIEHEFILSAETYKTRARPDIKIQPTIPNKHQRQGEREGGQWAFRLVC